MTLAAPGGRRRALGPASARCPGWNAVQTVDQGSGKRRPKTRPLRARTRKHVAGTSLHRPRRQTTIHGRNWTWRTRRRSTTSSSTSFTWGRSMAPTGNIASPSSSMWPIHRVSGRPRCQCHRAAAHRGVQHAAQHGVQRLRPYVLPRDGFHRCSDAELDHYLPRINRL